VRTWLGNVLAQGIERGLFTPGDVTRHIPPREWVREVPIELVAKLIAAGLTRPTFDPAMALEVLTPDAIGEHVPPNLVWAVIDEGASRAFGLLDASGGPRPAPA